MRGDVLADVEIARDGGDASGAATAIAADDEAAAAVGGNVKFCNILKSSTYYYERIFSTCVSLCMCT